MNNFINFYKEKTLAVGALAIALGFSIYQLLREVVEYLVNPVLYKIYGPATSLQNVNPVYKGIMWLSLLTSIIDFLLIVIMLYLIAKILGLHKKS